MTQNPRRRLILLGAPGVGKGTQAELLGERFGACHLSVNEIFRAAKILGLRECTPAMKRALVHIAAGERVPDEIVLSLVADRTSCLRCGVGFMLDGFPCTVAQAEALGRLLEDNEMAVDAVVHYELSVDDIVARMGGHRTCMNCKGVYHVEARRPKQPGICDHCGLVLQERPEDRAAIVRGHAEAYEQRMKPLVEFYRRQGLLVSIPATGTPAQIFERTLAAFAQHKPA
jgi:adenylate kinase